MTTINWLQAFTNIVFLLIGSGISILGSYLILSKKILHENEQSFRNELINLYKDLSASEKEYIFFQIADEEVVFIDNKDRLFEGSLKVYELISVYSIYFEDYLGVEMIIDEAKKNHYDTMFNRDHEKTFKYLTENHLSEFAFQLSDAIKHMQDKIRKKLN